MQTLKMKASFARFKQSQHKRYGKYITVVCANVDCISEISANNTCKMHYGIIITKKLGSAVVRNKLRRRIKACIHQYITKVGISDTQNIWKCAGLFIPKQQVIQAGFTEIAKDIDILMHHMHEIYP